MPLQAKTRVTARRRTTVVVPVRRSSTSSPLRAEKSRGMKKAHAKFHIMAEVKAPNPANGSGFTKALKFLETLTDYERLRIVRYNTQNFEKFNSLGESRAVGRVWRFNFRHDMDFSVRL